MSKIKLSEEQKNKIKKDFGSLSTIDDFCFLLNYCQKIIYNQEIIKFNEKTLKYFSHPNSTSAYQTFQINKKNGGNRTIHAPQSELKIILRCINLVLLAVYKPHKNSFGFIENKSVVSNALQHANKNYVFNIDLKDFFPTVEIGRILQRLNYPPFNLNSGDRRKIALFIGWLSTTYLDNNFQNDEAKTEVKKRVLPQGSPVSPILTNIICERLDILLTGVATRFGATYSRYADDISFSSQHFIYGKNGEFRNEIANIIHEQYFTINQKKVRLQRNNVKQEVTGITVNNSPNVSRRYIKTLRMWLYYLESYENEKALELFLKSYTSNKGHIKKATRSLEFMFAVLRGKLDFLKMVKGVEDPTFSKLHDRFSFQYNRIMNNNPPKGDEQKNNSQNLVKKNIVDLILEIGIENALKNYNLNGN